MVLAGAGKMDGSEIQEAVLLLTAIDEAGLAYQCFAPDVEQHHVVDHLSGEEMPERRSVMRESARIARGEVQPLSAFRAEDFDALAFPGGFGVAKNLCTYALAGADCTINEEVRAAIVAMHAAGKPIGAMCIAPILLALALGKGRITLGGECDAAADARKLGAETVVAGKREAVIDPQNKLFTTPCYMLDSSPAEVAAGAREMVGAMVKALA